MAKTLVALSYSRRSIPYEAPGGSELDHALRPQLEGQVEHLDHLGRKAAAEVPAIEGLADARAAPLFLADLSAYVALKTGDKDYLDDAVEYWIQAFPESKSPPVYLPDNSQWSRRKAMMLRTGHLLQYAHWKSD